MKESIQYDCYRGCVVSTDSETGEAKFSYREGCCKLADRDSLSDVPQSGCPGIFEVRFKNTRKAFFRNDSGQNLKIGDLVVVEAQNGHDIGFVCLEGAVVGRQMRSLGLDTDTMEFKRILRKARQIEVNKWQEAIAREQDTMIAARRIAAELGLDMKIGDVEFQGDGSKAIFYYIADGRVDFRQLIKVYADEFKIKIEMRQIGARQEAGLIGGLGVCGRELCCANHITAFKSISTAAARCQDLSLNPVKLAGQCGKLKCCINYEVAAYEYAQSRIPRVSEPLEFEDGLGYLRKTDILSETMYFSYEKGSDALLFAIPAAEVAQIQQMNRNGQKPASMKRDKEPSAPEFVTAVGEGSISRFDAPKRQKHRGGRNKRSRKQ